MNSCRPGAAFILLGLVALATLAAALLHGPALAGLGVVGAFVAPLLVASEEPDYWSLYIYIAVVTAAAFALARARLWSWLAVTAIVLGALWTFPGADLFPVEAIGAHVFNALAGYVLAAIFLVCGLLYGPEARPGEVDWLSTLALSAYLLVAAFLVLISRHDATAFTAFVVLTAATVAIAWRTEAATGAVPVAALLAVAVVADWAVPMILSNLIAPAGPAAPAIADPQRYNYGPHLFACRRMGGDVRHRGLPGARPFDARTGADLVVRHRRDRAARHADRAVLSDRGIGSLAAVRGTWHCCWRRSMPWQPRRWCSASRGPALRHRAQSSRPARLRRSRSRSPSRWRRAGSPSDWR